MVKAEIEIEIAEDEGLDDEASDIAVQRTFLGKLREIIPTDDPVWREFAPRYKRAVINERFYYGPKARLPTLATRSPKSLEKAIKEDRPPASPEVRRAARRLLEPDADFVDFMREKLRDLAGDDWDARFDRTYHEPRDIEYDRIRWEHEMGTFDPDNFAFTDAEKEALKDPKLLAEYMAW